MSVGEWGTGREVTFSYRAQAQGGSDCCKLFAPLRFAEIAIHAFDVPFTRRRQRNYDQFGVARRAHLEFPAWIKMGTATGISVAGIRRSRCSPQCNVTRTVPAPDVIFAKGASDDYNPLMVS
jgi:hypothetical protein